MYRLGRGQLSRTGLPASGVPHLAGQQCPARGDDAVVTSPSEQTLSGALQYLELMRAEQVIDETAYYARRDEITTSILRHGRYSMHFTELEHACRVAWRGSARCIGRLPWQTLIVRDCRDQTSPDEIFQACVDHLRA